MGHGTEALLHVPRKKVPGIGSVRCAPPTSRSRPAPCRVRASMQSNVHQSLVGKLVTLHSLKRFELNGLNGKVESWDERSGRAAVRVDDGRDTMLAVCPLNLQITGDSCSTATPSADGASVPSSTAAGTTASDRPLPAAVPSQPRRSGPLRLQQIRNDAGLAEDFEDIEDLVDGREKATVSLLHRVACERGYEQYVDPATGYSVFTALQLRTRPCCGHMCRHCPYGHENVPKRCKGR